MIETEREKKMVMKKVKELISLNVNLDDVIENAKKLKIKKDYERMYGRKQDEEELIDGPRNDGRHGLPEPVRRQEARDVRSNLIIKVDEKRDKLRSFFK